tara:strand:- start:337 stop:1101 length:765 start_codon:yes stop_codon:yes gene_type:complete
MKKFSGLTLFFLFIFFSIRAQDIPARPDPPRLVNDFANQLNATEEAQLEQKLVAYNDSTSSQIVIVVVKTTGDYAMADYALKIGREWQVGQKDKDNGIVILWASDDRKIFISTGYGLEGAIPDAIAKRIISQVITPEFKNGMYYRGLDRGIDTIFKYATGEYKADEKQSDEKSNSPLLIFFVIFIIFLIIIARNKGNNGGRGGGYRNSGGPILWPYSTHSSGGSYSGNWGGGGGGGFGGFGGGSFGGGGAGGSY